MSIGFNWGGSIEDDNIGPFSHWKQDLGIDLNDKQYTKKEMVDFAKKHVKKAVIKMTKCQYDRLKDPKAIERLADETITALGLFKDIK